MSRSRILITHLIGALLCAFCTRLASPVVGQPDPPPTVALVASPGLTAAQSAAVERLAAALAVNEPLTAPPSSPVDLSVTALPGADGSTLHLAFVPGAPPGARLFSRALLGTLQARQPIVLSYTGTPQADSTARVVATFLLAYAAGQPSSADDEAALAGLPDADPLLAFYRASRLHAAGEYAAALALLQAGRDRFLAAGPDWTTLILWNAATAEALAQTFAFDRALTWDTHTLRSTAARSARTSDPLATALLAELYLLRGRHRLYLYEWDAVLADYDAAIALAPELPRAYYLRGLLHYTQNARPAALADFTRYLELETDPDSPLRDLAQRYAAELEALLATPWPGRPGAVDFRRVTR